MVKPLKPSDIGEAKKKVIPDEVIEVFNELIAVKYTNGRALFKQKDVVARICSKMNMRAMEENTIFENGWLNVEEMYRAEGWKVTYDKPAYSESYDATFEFRKTINS